MRVDVVADRELAGGDDALGLEADVEEHLVGVDLHHPAGDDVAVVELDDRRVDRVGERQAAEVVEHDDAVALTVVGDGFGLAGRLVGGFVGRLVGRGVGGAVGRCGAGRGLGGGVPGSASAAGSPLTSGTGALVASVTSCSDTRAPGIRTG